MTETNFKPCPFCGGKAKLTDLKRAPESWVECTECGARTRFFSNSEEAAVSVWNARLIESKMKRDVVKLKMTNNLLKKRVKRLQEALEVILDATKDEQPYINGIGMVAYMALEEEDND